MRRAARPDGARDRGLLRRDLTLLVVFEERRPHVVTGAAPVGAAVVRPRLQRRRELLPLLGLQDRRDLREELDLAIEGSARLVSRRGEAVQLLRVERVLLERVERRG